ncbi:LysR family transcriptional regulator [Mesosutterella sp. AGMB02718]|uniref:LysR family transcriptional regulator n=1 Tax=Mesosutterella faecium TaxID=2925194 RepID=A0ABT7IP80_9BURK|nr:LysR family transcriptional regulator [Mesosutterella sp. AGMB02718]MDL2059775.1 LysR family transcriptional regulator [Mesosutterella sp. AGMB02718]
MDRLLNLQAWEVFFSLLRTGSISATAIEMNISCSAVSKLVQSLEKSLGCQLFDRSRRPFLPTPRALELESSVSPIVASLKSAIETCTEGPRKIMLRIAAPPDLVVDFLSMQIMRYCLSHENLSVELSISPKLEDVLEGSVDAALLQRPVSSAGLVVRPCITCSCYPLASPAYLKKNGTPQTLDDLKQHTGLLLRWNGEPPTQFLYNRDGVPSKMLSWNRAFVADNQVTLRSWAIAGCGITLDLAASHVIEELKAGQLVPVLKQWHRQNWELCVVTRADREKASQELKNFATWWASKEGLDSMSRVVAGTAFVKKIMKEAGESLFDDPRGARPGDAAA